MKNKKRIRRRNRGLKIKIGNLVDYGSGNRGIYIGMEGTLAKIKGMGGLIKVPFKNLKKVLED